MSRDRNNAIILTSVKGERGPAGFPGETGSQGPTGLQGPQGKNRTTSDFNKIDIVFSDEQGAYLEVPVSRGYIAMSSFLTPGSWLAPSLTNVKLLISGAGVVADFELRNANGDVLASDVSPVNAGTPYVLNMPITGSLDTFPEVLTLYARAYTTTNSPFALVQGRLHYLEIR